MRIAIITLGLFVFTQGLSQAASRDWKDRKGNEIKAEYTGVLNGKIVLKAAGGRRIYVNLRDLSLKDRDYLVGEMTKRENSKDAQLLLQLMAAENQVPVIDPDAVQTKTGNANNAQAYNNSGIDNPFNPLGNPNAAAQAAPQEVPTEMYGLPLPSPELLVEDRVRSWTSLVGRTDLATFDRVLAPGFLRLKKADGSTGNFALVNFSKADIDYVKQVLQEDLARPVFPEGNGFVSLTPDDVSKGYRVWTDRKNVPLIGKFVGTKSKNVVIEVADEKQEYPLAGLSEADRTWIAGEVKRRADAAAAANQAAANNNPGNSGIGRSPFPPFGGGGNSFGPGGHDEGGGNRFGGGMIPRIEYKFQCEHCGKTWTGPTPISHCSECYGKTFYECDHCGHKWSTKGGALFAPCPVCNRNRGNTTSNTFNMPGYESNDPSTRTASSGRSASTSSAATSSTGSGSKGGQGVLMTILYVCAGLGVLGGIAGGLFKAFG